MAPHTRMCMRANRFVVSLGLISTMMLGLFGGPVALAQSDGDRSIAASPWSSIRISLVQDETLNQRSHPWPKARLSWRFSTAFLEGTSGKLPVWQLRFALDVTAKLASP